MVKVRSAWGRWKTTFILLAVFGSYLLVGIVYVRDQNAIVSGLCDNLHQVEQAASHLAQPTKVNTTDPSSVERITASNVQKAKARASLAHDLSCD